MSRYTDLLDMITDTDDCIVWPHPPGSGGYGSAWHDGRPQGVHVLALATKTERPSSAHHACHGPCHNRLCVNPRHLSWKTRSENMIDKRRDDTVRGNDQLSDVEVYEIRSLYQTGDWTQKEIARKYGTSQAHVSRLVLNQQRNEKVY